MCPDRNCIIIILRNSNNNWTENMCIWLLSSQRHYDRCIRGLLMPKMRKYFWMSIISFKIFLLALGVVLPFLYHGFDHISEIKALLSKLMVFFEIFNDFSHSAKSSQLLHMVTSALNSISSLDRSSHELKYPWLSK